MKILIVNPSFWIYGGGERVIVKLANYLTEHNHTCTILTTQMIQEIRADLNETRLIFCRDINELADWLNKIHQDFDVINYHNDPVQLLHFGKKTPSVWMCNEPPQICLDGKELPKDQKEAIKFIQKIVVADKFNQDRFKKIYGRDSEIINYGVDYDFWQKGDGEKFRKKYEIDEQTFVIVQAGFIHPMKNQAETLRVFKEVKETIPDAKLILAGYETPHKMQLEDYIFENNLQADVIFTGFVSQEELRDIYDGSNVFFAPIKTQGGWLSIFDALSTGMHVLISEEATCSSIFKEKNLGNVGDYVKNLIKCQEVGPPMQHHKDFVKENLSWDKFCEKMLEVFHEVSPN